jgi:AsmA protein
MKKTAIGAGIFVALLLLAGVSVPFFIDVERFKPDLETRLTVLLGRDVKLGHIGLSILRGQVTAADLLVAEDPKFGKPAFVKAKSLRVGVELMPFLTSRELNLVEVAVDQPEVILLQAPSGDWNFSSLGVAGMHRDEAEPGKPSMEASVQRIRVRNGRITLGRTIGHWKPLVLEQVDLDLRNFSSSSVSPFSLSAKVAGGGSIKLEGQAGPLDPQDTAMTPFHTNLTVTQLDLAGSGANDAAPEIAGLVSLAAGADSDGRQTRLKGKLKGEKLKLAKGATAAARPVELDFAVEHDLRKHTGTVSQADVHIGRALARLSGNYAEQGEAMLVKMKLAGPEMPVAELAAMLPALGVVLPAGTSLQGGSASAMLSMEGPADRLVTAGTLALNNTRLVGFDLPKKMATIEKLAGIKGGPDTEIQTLSANVRVAPEGASAQEIRLIVPALGELSGAGTVSPANALDFRMTATVHAGGLLTPIGDTAIPFTIAGTCAQPEFRPDVKALVHEEVKKEAGKVAGDLLKGLLGGQKKN